MSIQSVRDLPPPTWARDTQPEPEVYADWMLTLNREQMVWLVREQQHIMGMGLRCFTENHAPRIVELEALLDGPRVIHIPDTLDVDDLKRRVEEQLHWPGKVMLRPEERPRPVPYVHVSSVGTCGHTPPADWRATTLREVYPTALAISQCAREPFHPAPHIGVLFRPQVDGLTDPVYYGTNVTFPDA